MEAILGSFQPNHDGYLFSETRESCDIVSEIANIKLQNVAKVRPTSCSLIVCASLA